MSDDGDSDFQFSDNDLDDKNHAKIVENVLSLNKSQHLKRPSRTEPTLQISEFNLVKSVTGQKGSIQLEDLTKVLRTRKKHTEVGKKVDSTKKRTHTLPKPLEKPQAERIRRSVGYEKNRFLFDRWEAFVTSNRAQAHQVFPLGSEVNLKVEARAAAKFTHNWTHKSELQKELEKLDSEVEQYHIEDDAEKDDFPLTFKELKEKRKEAAKLRAHQSFKEAKARRQNKIKSKKYHRILRKEKIKQKLKEFEELQKTNPEEALKKLGEIEKARALERFSLRHKGTGQWAKSKQVRAKYDKESRQVLAEQLQISRELTQKQKHLDSESEDEAFETEQTSNPSTLSIENPWVGGVKPDKEVTEFVNGYKKFWAENNQKPNVSNLIGNDQKAENNGHGDTDADYIINESLKDNSNNLEKSKLVINPSGQSTNKNNKLKKQKSHRKTVIVRPPNMTKRKSGVDNCSGDWDIEEIFQSAEMKAKKKLKNRLLQNKNGKKDSKITKNLNVKKMKTAKKAHRKIDLSMPSQSKKQVIDEEMLEAPLNQERISQNNSNINALKSILDAPLNSPKIGFSENIDPDKFMKPAVINLDTADPNLMVENENTEENSQKNIIMEAFEDNDIIADFTKEKQEELDKDKPQNIDLNLPGWGSWAGIGIKPQNKRKRRRFIVKMPKVLPRRDDNKGLLIINEKASAKVKPHLVSDIPFPFKTVKDYEASIRAPIGNTFVPELAYRKYIRPSVQTKMGMIIEPATTSILMGKPNKN